MYPAYEGDTYGIFIHNHVKALKKQGCEVKVICPIPFAPFPLTVFRKKWKLYNSIPKKAEVDGVEVYYPRYLEFPNSWLMEHSGYFMYQGINKTITYVYEGFKFDVIHSHVLLPDGYAAMLINNHYKVPLISTVHGQDFHLTIYKNKQCRDRLFQVINNSTAVITVSTKLKNVIDDKAVRDKIYVINNGINPEECSSGVLNTSNKKIIISVSNLIKTKGIDVNIKAVANLIKTHPDILYYIIGDGPEKKYLMELVRTLGVEDYIKFTGRLSYKEVMKHMDLCDIFSLPSWKEGFGIVYIEAMAHGKPVIGIYGEGIEDVINNGENGFLVMPNNVEDLVSVMDYLLKDLEKAKEVGECGKKTVLNNFTWKHNAEKTIELYNKITNKMILNFK
jgi:glycosyltransferase involved in cell wall biosynthesis